MNVGKVETKKKIVFALIMEHVFYQLVQSLVSFIVGHMVEVVIMITKKEKKYWKKVLFFFLMEGKKYLAF